MLFWIALQKFGSILENESTQNTKIFWTLSEVFERWNAKEILQIAGK